MKTNLLEKTPAAIAKQYREFQIWVWSLDASERYIWGPELKRLKAAHIVATEAAQVK